VIYRTIIELAILILLVSFIAAYARRKKRKAEIKESQFKYNLERRRNEAK